MTSIHTQIGRWPWFIGAWLLLLGASCGREPSTPARPRVQPERAQVVGAARPPSAPPTTPPSLPDPVVARPPLGPASPWTDPPPPIPPTARSETREEPNGRRVTIARSADGREVWVTYDRPAGVQPLVAYTRYAGPVPADPTRFRILPTFSLGRDVDEGGSFVYVDVDTADALDARPYGEQRFRVVLAPGATDRATALAATFRARLIPGTRTNAPWRVVLGTPEALFGMPEPVERALVGWPLAHIRAPREAPSTPSGTEIDDQVGTDGAADAHVKIMQLTDAGRWEAWLVRGDRSVYLFGSTAELFGGPSLVSYDVGARRIYFASLWERESVRFFAVRIDATTLTRVGDVLAVGAEVPADVECGNEITGTIPIMVLAADDTAFYAQTFDDSLTAVLYSRIDRPGRFVGAHHAAAFYGRHSDDAPPAPPPLYRLRGAVDDPAAFIEAVPTT